MKLKWTNNVFVRRVYGVRFWNGQQRKSKLVMKTKQCSTRLLTEHVLKGQDHDN